MSANDTGDETGADPAPLAEVGPPLVDPAQAALARARAHARQQGTAREASSSSTYKRRPPAAQLSNGRDPMLLGSAVDGMVAELGWEHQAAVGAITGRWVEIVGAEVADHVTAEHFDAESATLHLRADSTAWATQVRMLLPTLMSRLVDELGSGVVRSVTVLGPTAPSWTKGKRTVPGRGPRDTYG